MRRHPAIVVTALLLCLATLPAATLLAQQGSASVAPDRPSTREVKPAMRLIVSYQQGPQSAQALAAERQVGARRLRTMDWAKAAVIELPPDSQLPSVIATLKSLPGVSQVEVDGRLQVKPIRGPSLDDRDH